MLVDTPPILLVSDAMVLASKVDGVVLITRAGRDSRDAVVSLREALDNCPTLGLAFVFTGAATQGHKPAYGKSYRQDPRPSTRPAPPDDYAIHAPREKSGSDADSRSLRRRERACRESGVDDKRGCCSDNHRVPRTPTCLTWST